MYKKSIKTVVDRPLKFILKGKMPPTIDEHKKNKHNKRVDIQIGKLKNTFLLDTLR